MTSKSVSTTDVSDNYADVKIRLDNAEKARTRYLELLAKAENVEAALKVEKELERLNTEIDQLRGQMIKMEHDVRFSTLTVSVNQKQKLGPLGYLFVGIGKGIGWLFVRG
jgi:predicted nuclease with TOPRIM domain